MPAPSYSASPIVTQAFRFMELSSLADFGEDSDEARAVVEVYPVALRACLEFTDWSFASMRRRLLAAELPILNADDPDLPYFFHLPEGCVEIRELTDSTGWTVAWRRDAEGIRAEDAGPLSIRFTGLPTNENSLPAAFQTAAALHVAALMGPRFMGGVTTKLDRIEQMKLRQLQLAAKQDGRQASALRYDGEADPGDWSTEATR